MPASLRETKSFSALVIPSSSGSLVAGFCPRSRSTGGRSPDQSQYCVSLLPSGISTTLHRRRKPSPQEASG